MSPTSVTSKVTLLLSLATSAMGSCICCKLQSRTALTQGSLEICMCGRLHTVACRNLSPGVRLFLPIAEVGQAWQDYQCQVTAKIQLQADVYVYWLDSPALRK